MDPVRYHKTRIGERALHPETLMLGYGYDPALSEGSVKPPEGQPGLVYSRFNRPNLEIVEDRLAINENAESALVFASGMATITTAILAHARPGEAILHSRPLYGGTEVLISRTLAPLGIMGVGAKHSGGR